MTDFGRFLPILQLLPGAEFNERKFMKSIFTTYFEGIKLSWKEKKLIFLIYGIQVLLAWLMTLPVSSMLDKTFSASTSAQDILQQFDLIAFSTFFKDYLSKINIICIIVVFAIMYSIISTFIGGGIIWLYVTKSRFTLAEFLSRCVQYFARFSRLFLVSILFFITAILSTLVVNGFFESLTEDSISEVLPITLTVLSILLLIALFAFINMQFDYAKIITVNEEKFKMFFVPFDSLRFIWQNFFKATALYGLYFLSAVILLGIYLLMESFLQVQSMTGIILFLILTQAFIILRQWVRLSFLSGQTIFYQNNV